MLMHNFSIKINSYSFPKIAKKFAQEEINKILDACLIENSLSNYNFPLIFVKKKPIPGTSKDDIKWL